MIREMFFLFVGGIGLFFFGMQLLSEGLKNVSGERLRSFLHSATKYPVMGVIIGAVVTGLIQSSSAVSVMVVGLVNAGLLALKQAIPVIMGANIGTTATAWIVSSLSVFKVTSYSLPAIGAGFLIMKTGRSRKVQQIGQVVLGFGLLFTGLTLMKDAFVPLKHGQHIKETLTILSRNPFLGILAGMIFTMLLQSSSATIAIVQVLAYNGVISFQSAIPVILGDNIGTTITAQLSSMNTTLAARRTAMSHSLFNVIGTMYMLPLVYSGLFQKGVEMLIPGDMSLKNVMFYIAVSHSLFNVFNTLVFLPMTGLLERMSIALVPKKDDSIEPGTQYLERHILDTPAIALEQVKNEIVYMLNLAEKSISYSVSCFLDNMQVDIKKTRRFEEAIDNLQSEITQYIVELSSRPLADSENGQLPVLIHSVNDIERIGDHSENISELAERKAGSRLIFSEVEHEGMQRIWHEVMEMIEGTREALKDYDTSKAAKMLGHEDRINGLQKELKESHVERLNRDGCSLKTSILFIDFVDNMEKVADHLANINQGIMGSMRWRGRRDD